MEIGHKEILLFQLQRVISTLCKNYLHILEDLQQEHYIHFNKLKNSLPEEYAALITQADYFDEDKYSHLRKRVLDKGGESTRDMKEEFKKYNIQLDYDTQ